MTKTLTADEVAAIVYQEQGFILIASLESCPVGSIHRADAYGEAETKTPLRVIGMSNHAEFAKQCQCMNGLAGTNFPFNHFSGTRYYRTEPCD